MEVLEDIKALLAAGFDDAEQGFDEAAAAGAVGAGAEVFLDDDE